MDTKNMALDTKTNLSLILIKIIGFTFALFIIWGIGLSQFVSEIQSLNAKHDIKAADAIVVLTGGSGRVAKGFELLEQQKGKKLFISGVHQGIEVRELLKLWRDSPKDLECCISLGYQSESTIENASETLTWLGQETFKSIILVTSNYHMKRALLTFNQATFKHIKISPYPVKPEKFNIEKWWQTSEHRNLIIREYNKYVIASVYFNLLNLFQE